MSEKIPIATLEDKLDGAPCTSGSVLDGAPCTSGSVLDDSDIDRINRHLEDLSYSTIIPEALKDSTLEKGSVKHARLNAMNLQSLSMASGALITWAAVLQMLNAKLIEADWVKLILMLGPILLVFLFDVQLQAGGKKRR